MKKTGILIFARMNSIRFPGKVLKKIIFDKNLLEIVFLRLKKFLNLDIVVCTSLSKNDDKIVKFCKKKKIKYFRGNLNNVFDRTINCLKKYNFNSFVRVNADRPFVDYIEINKMIKIFNKNKVDIVTNILSKNCPKGLTSEVAKSKIFLNLEKKIFKKKDKEHIFNFFYRNKKKYRIFTLENKLYKKNYFKNLSIDWPNDLQRSKKIFNNFGNIYVSTKKILNLNKNEI